MMPGTSQSNLSLQSNGIPKMVTTKRRVLPVVKRATTMPGLSSRLDGTASNGAVRTTDSSADSKNGIFSPRKCLSPDSSRAGVLSPRSCLSPPRNPGIVSPRLCLSPTSNGAAPSPRLCLSPPPSSGFLSPRSCLSPTRSYSSRSEYLSPPRSCLSPTNSVGSDRSIFSRSPSPSCSLSSFSSRRSTYSNSNLSSSSENPRRVFPQTSHNAGLADLVDRDQSPVVFDAGLSFLLNVKQKLHHRFKPTAAHLEPQMASSVLSDRIAHFLRKSDHVMDEWKRMGHSEEDAGDLGRSKSATNIRIRGFINRDWEGCRSMSLGKRAQSMVSEDPSVSDDDSDRTISEGNELSEMTADLAEEHSTSTLATERLEAETSERLRLERELQEIQVQHSTLSATSERLETELLYLRAVDAPSEDEDGTGDAGVYKQRYERVLRELEFTKHRLQQQHEDDLEQLVALKKQLEKKLSDAYEEVQEQRQVAGQWKRKVQKLQAETNDLRLLSEEQNSRNTLLEKKQRKFDAEFQMLQEQYRQEKQQRDRSSREREMALGEKYTLEQNLSATRLELELKEEQVNSLTRELDDLVTGGHTDLEVAALKRSKNDLEKKLQEQEEELDDLAGQLAMLGQAKLRLEMNVEQQRKESRREVAQRDEELEDVRCNATKKVKALESQLESEHEERTLLLREKHELERRVSAAEDAAGRSVAERDQVARLKRDLRRTRALLRDAHLVMQKNSGDASAKTLVRQLRNQLEDAELARASAVKSRQTAEAELSELQGQLEEASRGRADAEERAASASRQGQELRTQLDENEEELAEVLKKYRSCVQQLSTEQLAQQEQAAVVAQLEQERAALRDQLSELTARLECVETLADPGSSLAQRRLELKTREMESRLELEQTTRARLEVQISRLKDAVEKLQSEATHARAKEQSALNESRKVSRGLREARDEVSAMAARESEATQRRKDAETRLEAAQAEALSVRADLRLALTRINDLQTAIQDDCSQTESDHESESDESIESFLVNNDTSATWDRTRVSLARSPRQSPADLEANTTDLPKTISDSTTKESYA